MRAIQKPVQLVLAAMLLVVGGVVECPNANGQVHVEADDIVFPLGRVKLMGPTGLSEVVFDGTARMLVYFEGTTEGAADDDDDNGLEEVITRIVDLELTGTSVLFGPVHLREHPDISSTGQIEELTNTRPGVLEVPPFWAGRAQLFWHMFFQVEFGGQTYYTHEPITIQTQIDYKPPSDIEFFKPIKNVELVNADGQPTGYMLRSDWTFQGFAVETDVYDSAVGRIEIRPMEGRAEFIDVAGQVTQAVFFEGVNEGDADSNDFDHSDEVQTVLQDVNMAGTSLALRSVQMTLNPDIVSRGQIEETVNSTRGVLDIPPFTPVGIAASSFEGYFEIELDRKLYHTVAPIVLSSVITHKASRSGEIFVSPDYVRLFDRHSLPSRWSVGIRWLVLSPCLRCADFDASGRTNVSDFGEFADNWHWNGSGVDRYKAADMDCNEEVDFLDLSQLAAAWLVGCP